MRHFGGQCHCEVRIFSEVRILGDAAVTGKLIDLQMVSNAQSQRVTCVQKVNTEV